MIFAAGLGTRLRPLTDKIPKALIPVYGKPILEHLLLKLHQQGIEKVIINVHHLAGQIESYLERNACFNLDITISKEEQLLDTGGGLKKASWFFNDSRPFLVHNVDILCDADLNHFYNSHLEGQCLATLGVKEREPSRYLLFDGNGYLSGRQRGEQMIWAKPEHIPDQYEKLSFLGMHIISPELFKYFPSGDIFSILDVYLSAAAAGEKIGYHIQDHEYWFDLGRAENIAAAERKLANMSNHIDRTT